MNRKADFFCKTNRFESIRITNRIDSNRELECSSMHAALADLGFLEGDDSGNPNERTSKHEGVWTERNFLVQLRRQDLARRWAQALSDSLEFIGAI